MDFIASFDGSISNSRAPPPDPLAPKPRMMLTAALVDRGAAKLLSRMFCILAETKPTIDDDALVDGLLLRLLDIMTLVMADSLVGCRILLRNDFLAGVFAYCRRKRPAQEKDELKVILVRALPQLSFFYSNLMLFQDAINTVDANAPQSSFRDAATYSYWVKFRELLKYQLFVLHEFNLTGFLKPRAACDNLSVQCGTILFKEQLRSCAGCKSRMYCSDACQREDWSSGGHRDTCVLSRRIRIAFRSDLSRKDMHYFHFLLHKLSSHDAITLEHWAAHISYEQHTTTPVLQFVYGGQDSEEIGIATRPFVSSPHDFRAAVHPSRLDPLWDDWVDRARRSKGRMDLHVIHLAAGFHDRLLIIPRRSSSSFVNDNAARLFRTVPGVATAGQGGVWKFEKEWKKLEMPKNLEVIH
ncbi:hypothetical protein C8F01DRAFT_1092549 [Mycena amicta]|nr:hypothetical protein C8F01DRAFT_1092549 [Mycena amicta]